MSGFVRVYQSVGTYRQFEYAKKSLVDTIGDKELSELTEEDIIMWQSIKLEVISTNTMRGYTEKLRTVIKYHRARGYQCINPEVVYSPKKEIKIAEYLTSREVNQLIKVALEPKQGRSRLCAAKNAAIIATLYSTGLRIAELCNLKIGDLNKNAVTVIGKGSKPRIVYMDKRANKLVKAYHILAGITSGPVFQNNTGQALSTHTVREAFTLLSKDFGKRVHPHTMRHSFATNLLANGCHIYTLSRLLGHSSIQTTAKYLHIEDPELSTAYRKYHTF